MDKPVRRALAATFPCQCGSKVRVTWLHGACFCGRTVEPLGPRFRRTLAEIRALPEVPNGS